MVIFIAPRVEVFIADFVAIYHQTTHLHVEFGLKGFLQ